MSTEQHLDLSIEPVMKPPDDLPHQNQENTLSPDKKHGNRNWKHSKGNKKQHKHQKNWKIRYNRQKSNNGSKRDSDKHIRRNTFNPNLFKNGRKRSLSYPTISKFFLPYKRPRKEGIIPPTKFLLGGNISDPLNLNSLQDEDINRAMNAITPKSSPLPTPPRLKIDVIIPPNICDPLHLLDPVDYAEYEKQLSSPLKPKTRNRKVRKRKAAKKNVSLGDSTVESINVSGATDGSESVIVHDHSLDVSTESSVDVKSNPEKVIRDLKLDLGVTRGKRRESESDSGPGKSKEPNRKVRRMDSMDKIVSPVVPQPGAWMRPHTGRGGMLGNWRGQGRGRKGLPGVHSVVSEPDIDKVNTNVSDNVKETQTAIPEEKTATIQATSIPLFKPENRKYQYGNYDRYYGYRNLNESMDVRLKVFLMNKHLFAGKDVLDIGCNVGHVAVSVAKDLGAKSVTGIDIDKKLITKANKNLRQFVLIPEKAPTHTITSGDVATKCEQENVKIVPDKSVKSDSSRTLDDSTNKKVNKTNKKRPKTKAEMQCFFPVSLPLMFGPMQILDNNPGESSNGFPYNIVFKHANYVLKDENLIYLESTQFDLVLCLSVSKWLHLNYGDAGLKLAFKRMFAQLRPGGKLILEAQNWASYKKKNKLTETIYHNFRDIKFYPVQFRDYLLSPEVGFSQCTVLGVPQHLSKGFRRPIHLYTKGDFTPSQAQWSDTHIPSQRFPSSEVLAKKQVYADVVTPSYHSSSQEHKPSPSMSSPNVTVPFYNPRSGFTPSYPDLGNPIPNKNVYAPLPMCSPWSPSQQSPRIVPTCYVPCQSPCYEPSGSPRYSYRGASKSASPGFTPNHPHCSDSPSYTPSHTPSIDSPLRTPSRVTPNTPTRSHASPCHSTRRVYAMVPSPISPRSAGSDSTAGTPHHPMQSPSYGGEYSRNVHCYAPRAETYSPQIDEQSSGSNSSPCVNSHSESPASSPIMNGHGEGTPEHQLNGSLSASPSSNP